LISLPARNAPAGAPQQQQQQQHQHHQQPTGALPSSASSTTTRSPLKVNKALVSSILFKVFGSAFAEPDPKGSDICRLLPALLQFSLIFATAFQ
jgi:hypothetical protein